MESSSHQDTATGFDRMYQVLATFVGLSLVFDALDQIAVGIAAMAMATAWAGWAAFTNSVVGCWKCTAAWLTMIPIWWLAQLWAASVHTRSLIWGAAVGLAAGLAFSVIKTTTARTGWSLRN